MVDANKLRGKIAERGMTQGQVAGEIGVTEATFCRKLKSGRFGLDEAEKLIQVLHIEDPVAVFFANRVT